MNSEILARTRHVVFWKCETCGKAFSPGSEQCDVYLTICKKLCIPCIGKIDARINEINKRKNSQMKPFNASEFISNEETPVVARNGNPVEIITVKGRGERPILGYASKDSAVSAWCNYGKYYSSGEDQWDLFFAPKVVTLHIFQHTVLGGILAVPSGDDCKYYSKEKSYTHIGTITGPIVPPDKSEASK